MGKALVSRAKAGGKFLQPLVKKWAKNSGREAVKNLPTLMAAQDKKGAAKTFAKNLARSTLNQAAGDLAAQAGFIPSAPNKKRKRSGASGHSKKKKRRKVGSKKGRRY